jgi:hypothetical protein
MTSPQFIRPIPHKTSAIKKLDEAISSHVFRPQYLLDRLDLISALEEAGRLTPCADDAIELQYWLLDGNIMVLEDEFEVHKYGFQLQTNVVVVLERCGPAINSSPIYFSPQSD